MSSEATKDDAGARGFGPLVSDWDEPLDAAGWDERFPGILDSIAGLAGATNIILQLARPEVGYGVIESRVHEGNVFRHPWKRARTTFTFLSVAMIGTRDEKLAYRKAVNRSHAQVVSTEASPVKYTAMDPELQLWVAACLFWGVADTYQRFRGPLSRERLEELYRRCQTLGTTLQVRGSMWPADYEAFERYFTEQLGRVRIDDTVRAYLDSLVRMAMLPMPLRLLGAPLLRFFTVGFLPEPIRVQMRYPWTARDQLFFETAIAVIGAVNRLFPRVVRQAPTLILMRDLRSRLERGAALV